MTLVLAESSRWSPAILEMAGSAREYMDAARAPATLRAYRSDWHEFAGWCNEHGLEALPASPPTVVLYLADRAGVKAVNTLQRRLTSISQAHQAAGYESPTNATAVRETWK